MRDFRLRYGKSDKWGEIHIPEDYWGDVPRGCCLVERIPPGVVVLDIDDDSAIIDKRLRAALSERIPFKRVRTPSGGRHDYFNVSSDAGLAPVISAGTASERRMSGKYPSGHHRSLDILVPGSFVCVPPTEGYFQEFYHKERAELHPLFLEKARLTDLGLDEVDWV